MKKTLFALSLLPFYLFAQADVRAEVKCAACPKESCRWQIQINSEPDRNGKKIIVSWDKSVVSRHVEKPLANPLHCNVDRSFNTAKNGYIKVWFQNESEPCDPTKTNPEECGVNFIFGPSGPSEVFPSGFTVIAPPGKQLRKVEHKSTLLLACGNFLNEEEMKTYFWDSTLGYDSSKAGEGFYSENTSAEEVKRE